MTETGFERPSTTSLLGDAIRQASDLFSAEMQLVRLEATEKLIAAVTAVVSMIVAAVFMMVALIFLLQGLVEFLVHLGWPAFAASFAIGGGIAFVAVVAIVLSISRLSVAKLKPERTIRQVADAKEIVQRGVS